MTEIDLRIENHTLTKKYFNDLSEGLFLVSNCYHTLDANFITPVFYEYVVHKAEREAQWKRIKEANADQRKCAIYHSVEDYKQEMQSVKENKPHFPSVIINGQDKEDYGRVVGIC